MIQNNYKILFSLEVLHTYFENSICTCLQFIPDAPTSNLINRFGFNIRSNVNGFRFYRNTTKSISEILSYITTVTGLSYFNFKMVSTNREFTAFTDLPTGWLGQLLFDSQSYSNNTGFVLLKENFSDQQDITGIGTINIHFEDILKYQLGKEVAAFQINFNARSTQWNYYVINRSAVQLNNPTITGKIQIDFEGPKNVTIQSGEAALLFSSGNTLLPLSETPKYMFDLVNNSRLNNEQESTKKSSGKIVFKGLPNPDPKQIGLTTINDKKQVISPMYVSI